MKKIIYFVIPLAILLISSCVTKKKNTQKSEIKTEVKEVISTIYTDTGKIVTIREIEYQTIYDTITKTYVQVKWKVKEKISENKAITEAKKGNRVITQEKKVKSVQKSAEPKPFNFVVKLFLWILILGLVVLLCLYLKKKFLP